MKTNLISLTADGILAGIFLSIGCAVNMSAESGILGAFLFSLGLFSIICFSFGLFTGKAGYIVTRPTSYIAEVGLTLLFNTAGTAIGAALLRLTRFGTELSAKSADIIGAKLSDSPVSSFVLAVLCGILMFTAVDGNRRCTANKNFIGALFVVVIPVMVFIIAGFNHCVADTAYFFISGCKNAGIAAVYFPIVVLGNAAGCMLIPIAKKFSQNPL